MDAQSSSQPAEPCAEGELISHSDRETHRIGERLGALCQAGDVVLLEGALGAGKTALTQGIGRGLGVPVVINSPTFTLVKEYAGRLPLYHFDLYRLDDEEEVLDLGVDEYLDGDGVCVVEWADRAPGVWPPSHLRVRLVVIGPHDRRLELEGCGARGAELCEALLGVDTAGEETR
jgi:tRNA threonylcarbamoyladenosine biosynthesis protein TsaE